ncbi:hypothetical protein FOL47_000039 [Perkinsus chesapeaki]|uniref:PDZ domain-containing protein n=1 Tax=Perkinsus chesapeaki TaxID=330153 RepID=A0A7J6N4E2_PERCH|nr:hypothetical protein FOL47_000039 [Perkinsus chesapeaki]
MLPAHSQEEVSQEQQPPPPPPPVAPSEPEEPEPVLLPTTETIPDQTGMSDLRIDSPVAAPQQAVKEDVVGRQGQEETVVVAPTERYEVTFALRGPLGMEFKEIEPPYRISRVHAGSIAERLDVKPGDCMRAVDGNALTDAVDWPSIRQMLSKRPVVVQFERGVPEGPEEASLRGVVGNWGAGILTSAISNVKTATHAAISTGIGSSKRVAMDGASTTAASAAEDRQRIKDLQNQVVSLQKQLAQRPVVEVTREPAGKGGQGDSNDSFSTLADAYASLQQQHASLLAQFDSMQQIEANAEDIERYKRKVKQLEKEKGDLEGALQGLGDLDTLKDRLRRGMEAEVNGAQQAREFLRALLVRCLLLSIYKMPRGVDFIIVATLREQVDKLRHSLTESQEALDSYTAAIDNAEDLQLGDVSDLQARLDDALAEKARMQASLMAEEQKNRKFGEQGEKVLQLTRSLSSVTAERDALKGKVGELERVVDSCLQKLQNEMQDRPYLIDRREVAKAVTAFIEGYDAGDEDTSILRLTEQLGFTVEERKALGVLLSKPEPAPRPSLLDKDNGNGGKPERFGDSFLAFLEHEVGDDQQQSQKIPDPDAPPPRTE